MSLACKKHPEFNPETALPSYNHAGYLNMPHCLPCLYILKMHRIKAGKVSLAENPIVQEQLRKQVKKQ